MYIAISMCGTMVFSSTLCAALQAFATNRDGKSNPSKCRCALCSTTALPNEDGCKTANLYAVFDLRKAQPAAAI
jgi:hypothetical protein